VVIREATERDVGPLSALASTTFADAFGYTFSPSDLAEQLEKTRSEAYFRRALNEDVVLVAEAGAELVGYVQFGAVAIPGVAAAATDRELRRLFVLSDHQRQGVGSALLAAALAHPRLGDARDIYLDVWDENDGARRLYERHGFRVTGKVDFVVDSRVVGQDLVMVRRHQVIREIIGGVRARPAPAGMSTKVVAIDGQGAAGKSSLAEVLARALGGAEIVHTDDFAGWDDPRDWWPRLKEEVLEPLSRNQSARFRRTDWEKGRELWGEVQPAEFVILEGVSASREAFQPFLTYSIWVETPSELRLERGLERDGENARAQWEAWMAEEDRYVARENPKGGADLVVPGRSCDLSVSQPLSCLVR
jgi:uridine kinase